MRSAELSDRTVGGRARPRASSSRASPRNDVRGATGTPGFAASPCADPRPLRAVHVPDCASPHDLRLEPRRRVAIAPGYGIAAIVLDAILHYSWNLRWGHHHIIMVKPRELTMKPYLHPPAS